MEILFPIAVALLLAYAAVRMQDGKEEEAPRSRWLALADAVGLKAVRARGGTDDVLSGRHGALEVRIETMGQNSARITIEGLTPAIALRPEGIGDRVGKAFQGADVQTGDADFDRAVYVEGSAPTALALLDAPTRIRVENLFAGRGVWRDRVRDMPIQVRVADGALVAGIARASDPGEPRPMTLETLLDLAERLVEPDDRVARLAANAAGDPQPGVRRRVLHALVQEAPNDPRTRQALDQAARADVDAEVRLEAAVLLRDDGRPMLEVLALDPSVADDVSAAAFERLGQLSLDLALRVLDHTRRAGKPLAAVAAATALGAIASAAAEPPLVDALGDPHEAVTVAAAGALGAVGTAESVPPLRVLETRSRGTIAKAARESVARIQERMTGASPGQLALSGAPQGHVSLADDTRGRVGLPEPPGES